MNTHRRVPIFSLFLFFSLFISTTYSQNDPVISRSFEMRYFSDDPRADGETDFKGETEIFTTDQRIEFLDHYAGYATRFFNDPNLDKLVVSKEEIKEAVQKLKPQPLPEIRSRIPLTDWKYLGSRPGQTLILRDPDGFSAGPGRKREC